MMALEELEELNKRLGELEERLATLSEERSELLLRIETVATLRQEAFKAAMEESSVNISPRLIKFVSFKAPGQKQESLVRRK